MKFLFTAFLLFVLFGSCKESGVSLSKPTTFVHYFNDGNNNQAIDLLETSDKGLLILANSSNGAINLTKVDAYGNFLWKNKIVAINPTDSLAGSNFVATRDDAGNDTEYVIVGRHAYNNSIKKRLFVAWIDPKMGDVKDSSTYKLPSYLTGKNISGVGVTQSTSGTKDIFVVGTITDASGGHPTKDMFFSQITSTKDTVFTRAYGAGTTTLASRLYLNFDQSKAYWGGTRLNFSNNYIGLTRSGFNSASTDWDNNYPTGSLSSSLEGHDFCGIGFGFGFVGSHKDKASSNYDSIVFAKVDQEGNLIGSIKDFPLESDNKKPNPQTIQPANSICSTLDGGVLLLGTKQTTTDSDYLLIKVKSDGTEDWRVTQGGKYPDVGARVLQSSDGGYVILGTTTLANVGTVLLMKTDQRGNIE